MPRSPATAESVSPARASRSATATAASAIAPTVVRGRGPRRFCSGAPHNWETAEGKVEALHDRVIRPVPLDLTDDASMVAAMVRVLAEGARIDVLD